MKINKPVTGNEVALKAGQMLVSKTNLKGIITYVNRDFVEVSGFSSQELLHKSHNVVRHPDMPQAAFQDLWDTVRAGKPWNGLVKNRCKNGDYYWVDANVSPVFRNGEVVEYLSVRTNPSRDQIAQADALYRNVRANKARLDRDPGFGPLKLWNKLSLQVRMNTFLVALAAIIVLMGGLGFWGIDRSRDELQHLSNIFVYGAAAAMLMLVALAFGLAREILYPLQKMLGTFREIGEGNYNGDIDIARQDEIGELLHALKSMQIGLAFDMDYARNVASEALRIKQALDNVSADVMVADAEHNIIYLNKAVEDMFRNAQTDIRRDLPSFDAGKLLGTSIDDFHKNPAHQRNLLAQLDSGHSSELEIGGRTFKFIANPIVDTTGERLGTVVEWADRTAERAVEDEVQAIVESAKAGDLSLRIPLENKQGFFGTLSTGINDLVDVSERVINDTVRVLGAMARGELSETIEADYKGAFGQLKFDANSTVAKLNEVIGKVKTGAGQISTGAEEISQGNFNLSQRTEKQASSLEQTASGMEQMTSTVKQNADNATQANQLASGAKTQAEKGGDVVSQAVAAMAEINHSSKKIADITGVIDEIAFQTNLLALNAAVEAARAGDQGRGFAVVASEVRNLAQRSAGAAKEIKDLIEDSVAKVESGTRLVDASGQMLEEIVTSVKKVSDIIAEIAAAGQEQSIGIEQVNKAVMQMDEMTQQNAALVEQAAAASESMSEQARGMNTLMAFFQLGEAAAPVIASGDRRSGQRPWSAGASASNSASTGGSPNKIDFTSARSKHLSWKTRIRGFLDGKETLSEDQAVSHRDCDLGKWLYSVGMNTYGQFFEMQQLEKTHARMHGVIKDIVRLKHSGQDEAAEGQFTEISTMSDEIVALLTQVEGKVKAAGAGARSTGTETRLPSNSGQEWDEF